jgi:hypothetical protein
MFCGATIMQSSPTNIFLIRQVANLWVEATRAFIYLAANQREAALQVRFYGHLV